MGKETKNELIVTKTSTNEIVLYQPDETVQLEVRLQDETVWLNQQQIAVLFGTQRQAITKHLKNIFESGELDREATCSILELVQILNICFFILSCYLSISSAFWRTQICAILKYNFKFAQL